MRGAQLIPIGIHLQLFETLHCKNKHKCCLAKQITYTYRGAVGQILQHNWLVI
jgi:hypothetical protein